MLIDALMLYQQLITIDNNYCNLQLSLELTVTPLCINKTGHIIIIINIAQKPEFFPSKF